MNILFSYYTFCTFLLYALAGLLCGTTNCAAETEEQAEIQIVIDSLKASLSNHHKQDTITFKTLHLLSDILLDQNTSEALAYAKEAIQLAENIGYQHGRFTAYNAMGNILVNKSDYSSALFYFLQALRMDEELNNPKGKVLVLNNLGIVYYRMKLYEKARKYYIEALSLIRQHDMYRKEGMVYNNLGNVAKVEGDTIKSIQYYKRALSSALGYNDDYSVIIALLNLGDTYYEKGELNLAENYFNRVLKLRLKAADHQISACYFLLGKIAMQKGGLDKAGLYMQKAKEIADKTGIKTMQIDVIKSLSSLYLAKKDYKTALEYYMSYEKMKGAVFNESTSRKVVELQTAYELEKKDKEIQLLNKDKLISEAGVNRERLFRNSMIVAFFLVVIICIVFARNMHLKQKVNKILLEKNNQIEQQKLEIERKNARLDNFNKELQLENKLAKYEVLKSKTNPHFLFNSLTTLSSIIIKDPKAALEYVENFSGLYRMILSVGDVNLTTLTNEMKLVRNYLSLQQIRFGENILIDINIERSCFRMLLPPFSIQMLVENAIKHNIISKDNKLYIEIYTSGDSLIVTNNLRKKYNKVVSTATGINSILERYRMVTNIVPSFNETPKEYIVKLPLLTSMEEWKTLNPVI